MNEWNKYTYVCGTCDALTEITTLKDLKEYRGWCSCGSANLLWISKESATIQPTSERNKMEEVVFDWEQSSKSWQQKAENFERMFETYRQKANDSQSKINKIIDNLTEEYWYSEDMAEPILTELCEILDYEPKKEIEFTATIKFTGRIDVPMNEVLDFDLTAALEDAYVDINNGDIVIDGYELYDAEEC